MGKGFPSNSDFRMSLQSMFHTNKNGLPHACQIHFDSKIDKDNLDQFVGNIL